MSRAQAHFPFTLSCHQPFRLGGYVFGKQPHDFSGSTHCLWYPTSSACIPQTPSSSLLQPSSPRLSLSLSPWKSCPEWSVSLLLKSFLSLSSNDGAKSHPKPTPYGVFPQYFTENTKQKCHFTWGVFFFLLECKLLKSRNNVFCMFYCA